MESSGTKSSVHSCIAKDINSVAIGGNAESKVTDSFSDVITSISISSGASTTFQAQAQSITYSTAPLISHSSAHNMIAVSVSGQEIHFHQSQNSNFEQKFFNVVDPSPLFRGDSRTKQLKKLEEYYRKPVHDRAWPFVIWGMHGVGKSQLVMKFVELHRESLQDRCRWVDASNEQTLERSFREFSKEILINENNLSYKIQYIFIIIVISI